jgi:hypothetical protein
MVPPGLVASPFFSAEPAVSAPWVLAFPDGIELVELSLAPVVPEAPPVDGVRCVESLLGLVAAGPPDVELPPADEPALVCATARVLARVKAAANKYVVRCIRFPPIEGRL